MNDLEDEAFSACAELEDSYGVFHIKISVGEPLNVEADEEAVVVVAGAEEVGNPIIDYGRRVCDHCVNDVGVEENIVLLVVFVGESAVYYAYGHV